MRNQACSPAVQERIFFLEEEQFVVVGGGETEEKVG
jgi:hypothetical protein